MNRLCRPGSAGSGMSVPAVARLATAVLATVVLAATVGCERRASDRGGPTPQSRAATWTARMPADLGRPTRAQATADAVVVETARGVAVFDRAGGRLRWQRSDGDPGATNRVYLTRESVTAVISGAGSPLLVRVYDPATGAMRAGIESHPDSRAVAVTRGTVFVLQRPDALGAARRLVAYDLPSGQARWSRDYPTPVQLATSGTPPTSLTLPPGYGDDDYVDPLAAPDPALLVVTSPANGGAATAVDVPTGKDVAGRPSAFDGDATTVGRRVVSDRTEVRWDPAVKECDLSVAGVDVRSGSVRWTAPVGQWKAARGSTAAECGGPWHPVFAGGKLLASTVDERPQVRDPESGAVVWTGDRGTYALALAGGVVLVRTDHGLGDLAGVDLTSGRRLWTAPSPGGTAGGIVLPLQRGGVADRFVVVDAAGQLRVFDARTGTLRWRAAAVNRLLGAGPDAVVASEWSDVATAQPVDVRLYPL